LKSLPVAANDNKKPARLLSFFDLSEKRGIDFSRRHLQRLEDAKRFPKRVTLGANKIGWVETEIDEWLGAKIKERDAA
jgi:prophage regulatory protein